MDYWVMHAVFCTYCTNRFLLNVIHKGNYWIKVWIFKNEVLILHDLDSEKTRAYVGS